MEYEEEGKELVIITGMSGAGKSETMNFFEDREYFCIDNFPISLFQYLNEIFLSNKKRNKLAVAIDIRNQEFIEQFLKQLEFLDKSKIDYEIIYLDARTSVLLSRYELSRRKHPLNLHDTLLENIEAERKMIKDFMLKADLVIDTTKTSAKELQQILEKEFSGKKAKLNVNLTSFGFKNGIPLDVMGLEESKEFYKMLLDMLEYLIPKYEKDGKSHLRIGIGCSGGQHRSATFVNMLYKDLSERLDYKITKFHREIGDKTEV